MPDLSAAEVPDLGVDDLAVAVPHTFDEINAFVFQQSCAFAGVCHSAAAHEGNLDLETDPYVALAGVRAANVQAAAAGLVRIVPCAPESSFLYIKMTLFQRPNRARRAADRERRRCGLYS